MNNNDLFNAFGEMDDDILERSETRKSYKKPLSLRIIAVAACFCILFVGVTVGFLTANPSPTDTASIQIDSPTSEKYSTLRQLVESLIGKEEHNTLDHGFTFYSEIQGNVQTASKLVTYKDTAFFIYENNLAFSSFNDVNYYEKITRLDIPAASLMIYNNLLIVKYKNTITIFEINNPNKPLKLSEYSAPYLKNCFIYNESLFIITNNGVCPCSYSNNADISEYLPSLIENNSNVEWGDEDINILGEPTRIEYFAITKVSLDSLNIIDKQAYYGDINNAVIGPDWFALITAAETEKYESQPDVYMFETTTTLEYSGKLDLAKIFFRDKNIAVNSTGMVITIKIDSISKIGSNFRIIAHEYARRTVPTANDKRNILALTANFKENKTLTAEKAISCANPLIETTLNEENRAILKMKSDDYENFDDATFIFVEFLDTRIDIVFSDMIVFGPVYNFDKELINIGNGIYINLNNAQKGWDIYNLSDSSAPNCISDTMPLIDNEEFFIDKIIQYSDNIIGILHAEPSTNLFGRCYNMTWRFYSVDIMSESPFTLIEERALQHDYFLANSYSAAYSDSWKIFKYEDDLYLYQYDSDYDRLAVYNIMP